MKNRKNKYCQLLILCLSVICGALISSCSEDLDLKSTGNDFNDKGLTIYIPNVIATAEHAAKKSETATRAGQTLQEGNEAKINDIYLLAFNTSGNLSRIKLENPVVSGEYNAYNVDLLEDTYNIYIIANLDSYLSGGTASLLKEDGVKKSILQFGTLTENTVLQSDNLPMGCTPQEIKIKESTGTLSSATNGVVVKDGKSTEIYADLTFLCSKVRYTILFDKNSFSNKFPKDDLGLSFKEASNIRKEFAWQEGEASEDIHDPFAKVDFNAVKYPDINNESEKRYLTQNSSDAVPDRLTPLGEGIWGSNQRAWQGVFYVPANNLSELPTTLKFNASGTGVNDSYDLPLYWSVEETGHGLEYGKFYDVVCKLEDAQIKILKGAVDIEPWTTQHLQYSLHGPYELVVETTSMELTAGIPATLWYRSDISPEDIRFSFPKIVYEGCEEGGTDFYIASVKKDEKGEYVLADNGEYQIEVKVNPEIPYNVFSQFTTEESKQAINYFEIIAGNIQKKITLSPLELKAFFTVSPQEILIDVREMISSGLNDMDYYITIDSNISNDIYYTVSDLPDNNGDFSLQAGDGIENMSNSTFNLTDGTGKLRVHLANFFKASDFWKTEKTFTLTLNSGNQEEIVTFKVKPYTTDYVIHFRSTNPNYQWTNPHIYVYQCLELPADLEGRNSEYAGVTVGYEDGDNKEAALEYAFTSGISFKGWAGYGGPSINDPNGEGFSPSDLDNAGNKWTMGFFIFKDGGGEGKQGQSYEPSSANSDRYNVNMDFNDKHIANVNGNWVCLECGTNQIWKSDKWPGIQMEKETGENEGWWKYTLSGVATPGKTMIMFTDPEIEYNTNLKRNAHASKKSGGTDDLHFRYPANNEVGIPLFDFADNEGWFEFDGLVENGKYVNRSQVFKDDKPNPPIESEPEPEKEKYRFYWPINLGEYIHLWTRGDDEKDIDVFTNYDTSIGYLDPEVGYFYYPITRDADGYLWYVLNKANNADKNTNKKLTDIGNDSETDPPCGYISSKDESFIIGKPESDSWPLNNKAYIYLRGGEYGWDASDCNDNNMFIRVYEKAYTIFRLKDVTIKNHQEFKIGATDWFNQYGGVPGNTDVDVNKPYLMSYSWPTANLSNMVMRGDFYGDIYIVDYAGTDRSKILYLIPK